jgi:hypothetical protein
VTVYLPTTAMECNTTEAAYGTWDFWAYWPDSSRFIVALVASDTYFGDLDGYGLVFENDGSLALYRYDGNVPALIGSTAAATVPADSWVHIRVTRDAVGMWALFYDVGAGWVCPFSITDNAYTTSDYITLYTTDPDVMLDLGNGRSDRAFTKYHGVLNPILIPAI